jgi:hypothetical protein
MMKSRINFLRGNSDMIKIDLRGVEKWRRYEWKGANDEDYEVTFEAPQEVQFREGGTTHRILNKNNIWYIVPAVGHLGCMVSFEGTVVA